MNFIVKVFNEIKRYYFKVKYYFRNVRIKYGVKFNGNIMLGGNNVINKNVIISDSSIGFGTYIGENSRFINTIIGKYCSIAANVKTIIATHPTTDFVSTHPAFFSTLKQAGFTYVNEQLFNEFKYIDKEKKMSIKIGNDVWIGENAIILGGVTIGDGAIIGANAVVTKDIEPYSINVGIPAKKIKYRFENDNIQFLQDFKWWDKPPKWIKENALLFNNIDKLKGENKK